MMNLLKKIALIFLLASCLQSAQGQVKPANASVILNPPHPIFLSNYYGIGTNYLQTVINFTDFSETSWDVRLRITIESDDIKIQTSANFIPATPISIEPGVPLILSGDDLYEYLAINNITLNGITAATLNQNGKLPEGFYDFCVDVFDYNTGIPLAHQACNSAFLFMEPPQLKLS